jgi:hypothetical protein
MAEALHENNGYYSMKKENKRYEDRLAFETLTLKRCYNWIITLRA